MKRKLLYIGSASDPHPIYKKLADEYIYVDGLPNSNYFEKDCHGYKLYGDMRCMTNSLNYRFGEFSQVKDDVLRFVKYPLTYYINTEWPDDYDTIKHELSDVTDLYLHGFIPDGSIYDHLPSLQRVWCPYQFGSWDKNKNYSIICIENYEYIDSYIEPNEDSPYYFFEDRNEDDEESENEDEKSNEISFNRNNATIMGPRADF